MRDPPAYFERRSCAVGVLICWAVADADPHQAIAKAPLERTQSGRQTDGAALVGEVANPDVGKVLHKNPTEPMPGQPGAVRGFKSLEIREDAPLAVNGDDRDEQGLASAVAGNQPGPDFFE